MQPWRTSSVPGLLPKSSGAAATVERAAKATLLPKWILELEWCGNMCRWMATGHGRWLQQLEELQPLLLQAFLTTATWVLWTGRSVGLVPRRPGAAHKKRWAAQEVPEMWLAVPPMSPSIGPMVAPWPAARQQAARQQAARQQAARQQAELQALQAVGLQVARGQPRGTRDLANLADLGTRTTMTTSSIMWSTTRIVGLKAEDLWFERFVFSRNVPQNSNKSEGVLTVCIRLQHSDSDTKVRKHPQCR